MQSYSYKMENETPKNDKVKKAETETGTVFENLIYFFENLIKLLEKLFWQRKYFELNYYMSLSD